MPEDHAAQQTGNAPRRRNHGIWLGPLVAFLGAFSYFAYFYRFPPLRDVPWLNLALVGTGLLLSALAVWRAFRRSPPYRGKLLAPAGLAFSLLLAAAFGFYIFSFSYNLPKPTPTSLQMTAAPDFILKDQKGRPTRLGDFRGKKVVLTFYRGSW